MLTIDEVEKVQRQKIEETELLNRFSGCSKKQPKTPFLALFFLHVRLNAPSNLLQQLFIFLTIKYIRQLYPASILLYAPLHTTLISTVKPQRKNLTYYYKNTNNKNSLHDTFACPFKLSFHVILRALEVLHDMQDSKARVFMKQTSTS